MRFIAIICVLLVGLMARQAPAQVTAQFVLLQNDAPTFTPGTPVDVWGLQVNNNSGFDIFTFNEISITGLLFIQDSAATGVARTGTALPEPISTFVVADTFFADDAILPTAFGATVDDATTLSAESIATLGTPWVANGASEVIAVFSVAPNGSAPLFGGGDAVVDGQNTAIVAVEPGVLGDANDDGVLNNLDISAFVLALLNRTAYELMYPNVTPIIRLDMNNDGALNNLDISAFVAAILG